MARVTPMPAHDVVEAVQVAETARQLAKVLAPLRNGDVAMALAAAREVDHWVAHLADPLTQARILYQLAEMLDEAGLHDAAQLRFEHSLALSHPLDGRLAHLCAGLCLQRLGIIYRNAGRLAEARDCCQQAIQHYLDAGDLTRTGGAWNSLGLAQQRSGHLEAASSSYRRAMALGEQTGDTRLQATGLGNLGKLALDRYDFARAGEWLRAAVKLTRELDDPALLASQVGDLGNVLRVQGRSSEAASCYEEALGLAETMKDPRGKQLSLGNLGALYQERGELSRALLYLERSYDISQRHGSAADQVADLVHLALLRRELAEPEQAAKCLKTALVLAEEAAPEFLPGVLNPLGHLALAAGDLDQAEEFYQRCLAIEEKIGDNYNAGTSWLNRGYVAWRRGDTDLAIAFWGKALELHQVAGNRSGMASAHLDLGGALLDQDDLIGAKVHLRAAVDIAESFPQPDDARRAWETLAMLSWRQSDLAFAQTAYEQAVDWAERSRATVVGQLHRIATWPVLESPYLGLIQLNLAQGDHCAAWEAVERARSRTLTELLGSSHIPAPVHLPVKLHKQEENLLARLRQSQTATASNPTPSVLVELLDLRAGLDMLWMEMQPLAPEYLALRRGIALQFGAVLALLA